MDLDLSIVSELARALGFVAVYLHGSWVSGRARADSDVDLAVLAPFSWSDAVFEERALKMAESMAAHLGVQPDRLDVQDLRAAPAHFRARVLTLGRLLYVADATALARFQARSLPEAWDEAIAMRPIREALRRRIAEGRFAS